MNKTDIEIMLVITTIIGLVTLLVINLDGENKKNQDFKKQAVSLGYAEYNSTNGNWQWKTNTIK